MIELRWTWKEQFNGIIASNALTGHQQLMPMLQYRRHYAPPGFDANGNELWVSEWTDVPLPPKPQSPS